MMPLFHSLRKFCATWVFWLIMLLVIISLAWPDPAAGSNHAQEITTTPSPLILLTATPLPAEYFETSEQTTSIICGSLLIIMIIVGGVAFVLRRNIGLTTPAKK